MTLVCAKWLDTPVVVVRLVTLTTSNDNVWMTSGRAEEGEVVAQFEMIHSHLPMTAQSLVSAGKFSEQELYQDIGKKSTCPLQPSKLMPPGESPVMGPHSFSLGITRKLKQIKIIVPEI